MRGVRNEFGSVYGLVNNAGIGTSGVLASMHDTQLERLVRLNTLSPLVLTKYVVRSRMVEGSGRIVNIASIVVASPTSFTEQRMQSPPDYEPDGPTRRRT